MPFSSSQFAAAVLLCEPTPAATAYLGMFHCINDEESLDYLLGVVMERAAEAPAVRAWWGRAGLLPGWGGGALLNHFDRLPPLHTPYNPPYLADLLAASMEVCQEQGAAFVARHRLQARGDGAGCTHAAGAARSGGCVPAAVDRRHWRRTATQRSCPSEAAALLLQWIGVYPVTGWLAKVEGAPAGFIVDAA
jgi:hypothetical protein